MRIVAFGDSTTDFRDTIKKVYSQRLEEELAAQGIPVEMFNSGVGSNTTEMARQRFERDVLDHNPDLVIIWFGLNDSAVDVWDNPPATKTRVSKGRYEENLRYFVQTLAARGVKVILMTPNPLRWVEETLELYGQAPYLPDDPNGFNVIVPEYAEIVRKIASDKQIPLIDAFEAFEQYGATDGQSVDDLLLDGMHPNDKGQHLVADLLLGEINKMR